MTRRTTQAAQAAKMIRAELKKHGIKARVKSSTYSMGSSVNVTVDDLPPATIAQIEQFCYQFQYGNFDAMTDSYEYSNNRDDIPQAKYVFVNNNLSDDLLQEAYTWAKKRYSMLADFSDNYQEAQSEWLNNGNVGQFVWRELRDSCNSFWTTKKPRIKVAA